VVMKSKKDAQNKKKRMLIFAAIGLLVAVFIFLALLLVSHYMGQERFYKTPTTEQGTE